MTLPPQMKDLIRFRVERDRALLTGDVREVRKFARRWYKRLPPPASPLIETAAMHRAIYASHTLAPDYRARSLAWLRANGFTISTRRPT